MIMSMERHSEIFTIVLVMFHSGTDPLQSASIMKQVSHLPCKTVDNALERLCVRFASNTELGDHEDPESRKRGLFVVCGARLNGIW